MNKNTMEKRNTFPQGRESGGGSAAGAWHRGAVPAAALYGVGLHPPVLDVLYRVVGDDAHRGGDFEADAKKSRSKGVIR